MKLIGVFVVAVTLIGFTLIETCHAKGTHKVHCSEDLMRVEVVLPESDKNSLAVYLDGMKGYPNPKCQPEMKEGLAEFRLSLKDIHECGVTRVVNKLTGKKVYYHKIIIEGEPQTGKQILSMKCITGPIYNVTDVHGIVKRDVLPVGFQEPEEIDITTTLTKKAPEPKLSVKVRQGGNLVSGDLNVSPGTPLSMEIFLDDVSAPIYGLGVSYMQVTDTLSQEETIIYSGCSVDPYLFENFNTVDGDSLSAKFRAFKFPESTYVQFKGTVNVCLDKCKGIPCSNGQIGYGRRRREVSQSPADPNKIYEISMTTFIKVNYDESADKNEVTELEQKIKQLKIANQKLARNSRAGNVFEETVQESKTELSSNDDTAKVEETILFTREIMQASGATTSAAASLGYLTIFVACALMKTLMI